MAARAPRGVRACLWRSAESAVARKPGVSVTSHRPWRWPAADGRWCRRCRNLSYAIPKPPRMRYSRVGARRIGEADARREVLLLRLGLHKGQHAGHIGQAVQREFLHRLRHAGELVPHAQVQRQIAVDLPVVVGEASRGRYCCPNTACRPRCAAPGHPAPCPAGTLQVL